jgi:hypothetical protein
LFDKKDDRQNLEEDVKKLTKELPNISSNSVILESIRKKILKQGTSYYQTLAVPTNEITMDPSNIIYERVIGSGTFGTVWKARIGYDNVAVKKMKTESLTKHEKAALKMEAQIMRSLSHPRIVSCVGVFETATEYCMVPEFWYSFALCD